MSSQDAALKPEMVNLTIDGTQVSVPKGTNLIDAAKAAGVEVPFYCYHPHLSVAGNCRMCQVRVKGAPKLDIACNTQVREGMEVSTHVSSKEVADAQAATLEFILINHPLDCTVCDQAGHCKLQDYHYDYNARSSRFLEEKEHKVKAQPLGPTVMLDGERCIMCTRCIRFCDEVTGTSELGMLNRGDRSVIAINKGKQLDNPLSGTVVDLCPVGALTHRPWRFNSRMWFTKETDSICPGCSTGCNVRVAVRGKEVVQVKARLNPQVNKEWLCDEGRYGFMRFLPEQRLASALLAGKAATVAEGIAHAKRIASSVETLVFLAPDLLLEEYALIKRFVEKNLKKAKVVLAYRERELTPVEKILISPDYAPNFRAAQFVGLVPESTQELQSQYESALQQLRQAAAGQPFNLLLIGDRAICPADRDPELTAAIARAGSSLGLVSDANLPYLGALKVALPVRSILEVSGLMLNRDYRLQYAERVVEFPGGTEPVWRLIQQLSQALGTKLSSAQADRELTLEYLKAETRVAGLSLASIRASGVAGAAIGAASLSTASLSSAR
jgi:NADH-quinone oxidoreductase subunit G